MTIELALLMALGALLAVGAGVTLFALARAALLGRRQRRLSREVRQLRQRLERDAASGFQDVERLFVELRDVDDPARLDAALREAGGDFDALSPEPTQRLAQLYERLGLVELHLQRLRAAEDWRTRADSALVLGHLGVVRAIPALSASLRDPDEDGSTVKAAAARALGLIRAEGAAEALVAELEAPGDWSSPRIAEALVGMGAAAVDPCIGGLQHESPNVRAWAGRVLGRVGDARAVPALCERLLDRAGAVRTVAAEALGSLADRRATAPLVEAMLRDPAAQVRAAAARALGQTADPSAFSALVDALDDPDPWTRIRAVEALEALRPEEPELLLEAVRSGREESARAAAVALERVGHVQRWVEQLGKGAAGERAALEERLLAVARLGGGRPLRRAATEAVALSTRARAVALLGQARVEDALHELTLASRDPEWPVRIEALRAWARVAPDGMDPAPLLAGLDDHEELVRVAALEGLVARGDAARVPTERLPHLVGQANLEARTAALALVRGRGDAAEREFALQLRQDPAESLRAEALATLGDLCQGVEDPAFEALLDGLVDPSEQVRAAAAAGLGDRSEPEATRALVEATFDAGPTLREQITEALASRGLAAIADELDTFMASDREEARLAVLWTLGKMGEPSSVPLLAAALEDPRPRVRASAAGALAKLGPPAEAALTAALTDPDGRTRAAAVNGLGRVGAAALALRRMLRDPDAFVRGRACVALGRVGDRASRSALIESVATSRVEAVLGLALLADPESIAALGEALDASTLAAVEAALAKEDAEVARRVRASLGLGDGAEREAWIESLRAALAGSRDPAERRRALELLAAFDAEDLPGRLGAVVSGDPDASVRERAVQVLTHLGGREDPALLRGLRDPDPRVRAAALAAGSKLGAGAGPAVLACADEPELAERTRDTLVDLFRRAPEDLADLLMGQGRPGPRAAAVAALGRIGSPALAPLLEALLADAAPTVRAASVQALAELGAVDALVGRLDDPSPAVRAAVMVALVEAEAIDGPADSLSREPDPNVRAKVVESLARLPSRAVPILADRCRDPHPVVRRAAFAALLVEPTTAGIAAFTEALAELDPVEAQIVRTRLLGGDAGRTARRALLDGPPELRAAAASVLAQLDAGRFVDALVLGLEDPSPRVRKACVDALAGCDADAAVRALTRAARDPDPSVARAARALVAGG